MFQQVNRAPVLLVMCCCLAIGQETKPPDNTEHNKRDQKSGAVTPDKQSNTMSDRTILQNIRKAVVAEPNFSTNAKNVKIVVRQGVVTLRGPVGTEAEKQKIEELATHGGALKVINRIEIAPSSSN